MAKIKIIFIINPISGGRKKDHIPALISKHLNNQKFDFSFEFTEYKGHAAELSGSGDAEYYIAAGGDGTLNEVASKLIHSSSGMGILPLGSGNGLARHLGIEMNTAKAIEQLNTAEELLIDTCSVNGKPFVNMAGVGFDAHIGKMFAESTERGFKTYVLQTLKEFRNYKPQAYRLKYQDIEKKHEAFLLSLANSSQYGNNAFIAPKADLQDGLFDVCLLKPFKIWDMPGIGFRLFNKTIDKCPLMHSIRTNELLIERENEGVAHLDGEPMDFGKTLHIRMHPGSLKILAPKKG
jgi:diacylglycerol kinase (ATP)